MSQPTIIIIGAGLAGSEAAWGAANRGCAVVLYEMRPVRSTPAHRTGNFAELVCSNSFRSNDPENAVGCLKEEMRALDSLTMRIARETEVAAGSGLAVDRELFAERMTAALSTHPRITICREEVASLHALQAQHPHAAIVMASGPLTAAALAADFQAITQTDDLYFYDSMAPLVASDSIDQTNTFWASRYGKGGGEDYLNCPLTRLQYETFVMELVRAQKVPPRDFEDPKYFEGCLPVEVMAERGIETLRHGPMKPMGLTDPRTGCMPYAVVQLRHDNRNGTILNIVGFQTRMTWPEQQRLFRTIPGLERAEFLRLGAMHRNTYLNSPRLLDPWLQLKALPGVYCAGQLVGVEGYVESAATGILVGLHLAGVLHEPLPVSTALGSLIEHVTNGNPDRFEPMNANWGLTPPLPQHIRYRERKGAYRARAAADFAAWLESQQVAPYEPDNSVALGG